MKKQLAIELSKKYTTKIQSEIMEFDDLFQKCLNKIEQNVELETVPQAIFPFGFSSDYLRDDESFFINKSEITQSKNFKNGFFSKPK